jgi:DNA-binding beta-propeller fold protein YncE
MLAALVPGSAFLGHTASATNSTVIQQPPLHQLNHPKAVVADVFVSLLYIADTDNDRILMMKLNTGEICVVLDSSSLSPLRRPSGLALDNRGNLYIADTGNNRILCIPPSANLCRTAGSTARICVAGILNQPTSLAVDLSGNLYICDTGNDRILLRTSGGDLRIVRTDPFRLNRPMGVAVSAGIAGNFLFIADMGNNRILRRTPGFDVDVNISVVPTNPFNLNQPTGLAVDLAGNLYIANTEDSLILQRTPPPNPQTILFAGGGSRSDTSGIPATEAALNQPMGLQVYLGLYIADTGNNCIRRVDLNGIITTILGSCARANP